MEADFFTANRQVLMNSLKSGVVVMTGYKSLQWTADIATPFKQEASFWYMTGINEPDWWVIIEGAKAKTWLVRPPHNEHTTLFDGSGGDEYAKKKSGAHEVVTREKGKDLLRQLARQHHLAYTTQSPSYYRQLGMELNPAQHDLYQVLSRIFTNVQDCTKHIIRQRALKQPQEVKNIERAVKITADTYQELRANISTYKYEYEVEAFLSHGFRTRGADGHAYSPIVASGAHALTLHYAKNNAKLQKNKLVLIDAAASVEGYAADITRTYALHAPTRRQQKIHQDLQRVQRQIITLCQPGKQISVLQEEANRMMKEIILSLGLADEDSWRDVFPHAIGHGLGLDVHDPLAFETLQAGMVLTIEPGIYSAREGVGIRLEDDILVTDKAPRILSRSLPLDW